jgi:hypothetical protein
MKLFSEYKQEMNEGEKEREAGMVATLKKMYASDVFHVGGSSDWSSDKSSAPWIIGHNDPEFKIIKGAIKKRYERAKKIAGIKESEETTLLFTDYRATKQKGLDYLTEDENIAIDEFVEEVFEGEFAGKVEEGLFGRVIGGVAGFLVGPTIGKIIAKVLGIEKGVLYDMFTSRLVSTALGSAIAKYMTENKK